MTMATIWRPFETEEAKKKERRTESKPLEECTLEEGEKRRERDKERKKFEETKKAGTEFHNMGAATENER
ncbi:hypothetical protein AC249_AIPGENE26488 [Exaiptasia diaphana]|nr:hypothetical protein AC249_AIPGENE26488 [Exaiptasia diaphana]